MFHIWGEPYTPPSALASTLSFLAAQSFVRHIYWDLNFSMFKLMNKTSRVLLLLAMHIKMLSVLSCGQHFCKCG